MKTTTKFALIAIISALGFYNVQIENPSGFGVNLSFVENSASADSEESAGKSAAKRDENGTSVISMYVDGKLCTNSADYHIVTCVGTGSISCTPVHTVSNQHTTC